MRDQAGDIELRVHPPSSDGVSQVLGEACPEALDEVVHGAETWRIPGVDPFGSLSRRAGVRAVWPRWGVSHCGYGLETRRGRVQLCRRGKGRVIREYPTCGEVGDRRGVWRWAFRLLEGIVRGAQRPGRSRSDGEPFAIHTRACDGIEVLALESAIEVFDFGK